MSILAAQEAKWAALLGESPSSRTNAVREVRHKTLQVAQTRVQTVLNRLMPKDDVVANIEIVSAIGKLGF